MARLGWSRNTVLPRPHFENRSTQPHARVELKALEHGMGWRWLMVPLLIFVFTRIALLGVAYLGLTFMPDLYIPNGDSPFRRQYPAIDAFCRHDCVFWFSAIA